MDIKSLRYFTAAFEEKNLTAAAKRAFVAQPSISAAISTLEGELSEQLFIRHKKGVTPTSAAERLYPMALGLLAQMEAVRVSFQTASEKTVLTVGVQQSIDTRRLTRLLKLIREMNMLIQLKIVAIDDPCDVRLISEQSQDPSEEFLPLWTEKYVLIVPAHHPFSLRSSVSVKDLRAETIVHRDYCENSALLARYADLSLDIAASASTEETAVALVAAGIGIAFLPEGCITEQENITKLTLKDVNLTRRVGLSFNKSGTLSSELSHVLKRWH